MATLFRSQTHESSTELVSFPPKQLRSRSAPVIFAAMVLVVGASGLSRGWQVNEWGKGATGIVADPDGNLLVVGGSCANYGGGEGLLKLDPLDGTILDRWWPIRQFSCGWESVVVDHRGDVIVRSSQYTGIQKRSSCDLSDTIWYSNALDSTYAVAVDPQGNVFSGGSGAGAAVSKLRGADGAEVWRAPVASGGGINRLEVAAVTSAANGDAVATGIYRDAAGAPYLGVARFSGLDGSLRWERHFAGSSPYPFPSGGNRGNAVLVDADDNTIVVGSLDNVTSQSMAVCKVSPGGESVWSQACISLEGVERTCEAGSCCGGPFRVGGQGWAVAVDASGDVIAAGSLQNSIGCVGSWDFSVVKLSGATGQERWSAPTQQLRPFTIPGVGHAAATTVRVDARGDVLAAGALSLDHDEVWGVAKASGSSGGVLWVSSPLGGRVRGMVLDRHGNPTITGTPDFRVIKLDGTTGADFIGEDCGNQVDDDGDGLPDDQDSDCYTCGNGRIEPGEQCDDGNTHAGDGCSASCDQLSDDLALLIRYAPALRYDATEMFFHTSVEGLVGYTGMRLDRDEASTLSAIDIGSLVATYSDGVAAESADALAYPESTTCDYVCLSHRSICAGAGPRIYGRVRRGTPGDTWLQYWMLYVRHEAGAPSSTEGDWAFVALHLDDATGAPDRALYSQHDEGEACPWGTLEHEGDHPVLYVAAGSHALYRTSGVTDGDPPDAHGGAAVWRSREVTEITDQTLWAWWPGHWGGTSTEIVDSPTGPAFQSDGDRWDTPGELAWPSCE